MLMRAKPEHDSRPARQCPARQSGAQASATVLDDSEIVYVHRAYGPRRWQYETDERHGVDSLPSRSDNEYIAVALGRFDALLGLGLTQILDEDPRLQIVDTDLDSAALEQIVARSGPLVALLDEASVAKPALVRLRASQPSIGIIVLAYRPSRAFGTQLLAAGAICVPKDVAAADILAAVHLAAESKRLLAWADGRTVERGYPVNTASLTPREEEVLEHLSRAESHAEIAHALQISVETVRTHSARIRKKLGVRSKRELIGVRIPSQSGF